MKAGTAERRRELDGLLVALSPRYDAVEADYERVLKHRNAWLRTWSRADDPATLDVWDDQLVRAGAELVRGRLKLLERLAAPLGKAYGDVAGAAADVAGAYEAAWAGGAVLDETRIDDVAPLLAEAVARSRSADLERRLTLAGPHRDDWRLSSSAELQTIQSGRWRWRCAWPATGWSATSWANRPSSCSTTCSPSSTRPGPPASSPICRPPRRW